MNIKVAKQKIEEARSEISGIISRLESETKLEVQAVHIERYDRKAIGSEEFVRSTFSLDLETVIR